MNKYEIIDTIGEGQYGVVLKAKNRQTGDLVAIKKFKEDDSDQQNKKVILRQVKILKMLNHQNIIELKEAFRKKGKIYLVCEFVDKNLLQILEQGSITPQRVRNYTYQLLRGVLHMHQNNIIHRDIKPENVLIGKNDVLKICDLGFARTVPSNGKMTDYVATRWYRPPQLLIGREDYDSSIDVWAIGCVMAEMIDGDPLFGGENDLDQLYLIQKCIGPLIPQHHQYFLKNPKFIGMKFPEINALDPIQRRYFGKIDKNGIDLLKKMLVMDPKSRISIEKALNHPYFGKISNNSFQFDMKKSFHQLRASPTLDDHHGMKVNIPVNNFLKEQKNPKSKDEKSGINKVTGLGKIIKLQASSVNPQSNGDQGQQNAWFMAGKGKSLLKKSQGNTVREKSINGNNNHQKYKNMNKNMRQTNVYEDEYYEQDEHWAQQETTITQSKKVPPQRVQSQFKKKNYNESGLNNEVDEPTCQQKSKKRKKTFVKQVCKQHSKNVKDNYNIIFNNNTYNLNFIDEVGLK